MGRGALYLEREGWGEVGVAVLDVAEEEVIGLHWVMGKQEAADGDSGEVIGFFEDGGSGMAAFGGTIAQNEAGGVAFDEALVEVDEEMAETFVGPAAVA